MNFARWFFLVKMPEVIKTDEVWVAMLLSIAVGVGLTALTWPYLVPVFILIVLFWLVFIYVHLERLWKKLFAEYEKNK